MKYIISIFIISIIIPQFALAVWWNPFSWKLFYRPTSLKNEVPGVIGENMEQIATSTKFSSSMPDSNIKDEIKVLKEQIRIEAEKRAILEKKLQNNQNEFSKTQATYAPVLKATIDKTLTSDEIYKLVAPSVVLIMSPDGSHGTGFVINDGRYILTNQHVVEKNENTGEVYKEITVRLNDGTLFQGIVLGSNKESDLALIYNGKLRPSALKLAKYENSNLKAGNEVYAFGYPKNLTSTLTFTKGIISAVRQQINGKNLIQSDVAINPGNSGGPLINSRGEVVGVNSSRYKDSLSITNEEIKLDVAQGLSFAIPIEIAMDLIPALSQYGQSRYEVYPIGSTQTIKRSVVLRSGFNLNLSCESLEFKNEDLAMCDLYKNYNKDYNWKIIEDL